MDRIFHFAALYKLLYPLLLAAVADENPLDALVVLQPLGHTHHVLEVLGLAQIPGKHDAEPIGQRGQLIFAHLIALQGIFTPVGQVLDAVVAHAALLQQRPHAGGRDKDLVTVAIYAAHDFVDDANDVFVGDATGCQTLGPHIEQPEVDGYVLYLLGQHGGNADKGRRKFLHEDEIELLAEHNAQRIDKGEEEARHVVEHHAYGPAVAARYHRHAYHVHPVDYLAPAAPHAIPFVETALRVVGDAGDDRDLVAPLHHLEGYIVTPEGLGVKIVGQKQTALTFHSRRLA